MRCNSALAIAAAGHMTHYCEWSVKELSVGMAIQEEDIHYVHCITAGTKLYIRKLARALFSSDIFCHRVL